MGIIGILGSLGMVGGGHNRHNRLIRHGRGDRLGGLLAPTVGRVWAVGQK